MENQPQTDQAAWWLEPDSEAGQDGLTQTEAQDRLEQFGPNRFRDHRAPPAWRQLLEHFRNPLVLILLLASGISALTGEVTNFVIIAAIVLLSVTLDFVQERRASAAADRLRESVSVRASVLAGSRNWRWRSWCRATSCGSRLATWCRPTRACCRRATSSSTRRC